MHVIAVQLKLKETERDAFMAEIKRHIAWTTENEAGCVQFDLSISKEDPNTVFLYEVYADDAALKAHHGSPSLAEFRDKTQDMVEQRQVLAALKHSSHVV